MDNGDGNGRAISTSVAATGMTRYVTIDRFDQYRERNEKEHQDIFNALWGTERTTGIVKDIHDIKTWVKIIGVFGGLAITIIAPIITTFLLKYMGVVN